MSDVDRSTVADAYRDGVSAVVTVTAALDAERWAAPACGDWDRTDTVRHLVGVADWYHDWLDRALAGDARPPFSTREFERRNAERVAVLRSLDGPAAVERFAGRATAYLDRAVQEWDVPFGFPAGTVTAGLHLGIAATEWHLHAWDLTAGATERHRPTDPTALFVAAGAAMARARGGVRGRLLGLAVPLGARLSPWSMILRQSGRS